MIERHDSAWHVQRQADCARQVMGAHAEREAGRIDHEEMVQRLAPVRQRTHERLAWAAEIAPGTKT